MEDMRTLASASTSIVDFQVFDEILVEIAKWPAILFIQVKEGYYITNDTLIYFDLSKDEQAMALTIIPAGRIISRELAGKCGFALEEKRVGEHQSVKWVNPLGEGFHASEKSSPLDAPAT